MYPLSRVLRGKFHTDIFVEVTNIRTSQTLWAHVTQVAEYPSRLRLTGHLRPTDVRMMQLCCCRQLNVNWQNVIMSTDTGQIIRLPNTGAISVFTPTTIKHIDPHDAYAIRILGRILDHVMEIPTRSPEVNTSLRAQTHSPAVLQPTAPFEQNSVTLQV